MFDEISQHIKEYESRINAATNSGASVKEKTLDKLNNEAKKLLKEVQNINKNLQIKQSKLEKTIHNIENIDEYLQELSHKGKNKAKQELNGQ